MNDNINADMQAQTDNLQADAVNNKASQDEKKRMLAGKFADRNGLEKSTLEIFESVEGRQPSAGELLALKSMEDDTLEDYYQKVQSDFTRMRQAETQSDPEEDELREAIRSMGFVSKDELDRQKYEEEQLNLYFAQDPTAKDRKELIQSLGETPRFQGKSFAEIDAFIKETANIRPEVEGNTPTKPSAMGRPATTPASLTEMSDEDFLNKYGSGNGDLLSR